MRNWKVNFFNAILMTSSRLPGFLVLLFAGIFTAGCQSTVQEGDAVSSGQGSFRSSFLPKFSIGKTGVHEFRVSNLKSRSYPARIRVYGRTGAYSGHPRNDTFSNTRLRVDILDYSSRRVLASKTFRLNTFQFVREGQYDQWFWFGQGPNLDFKSSYRVRVTVLSPSDREFDQARVMLW